jgi:hypothetical protein
MKIRKLFIGIFLLTFLIGLASIFLLKNKFIASRDASPAAEKVSAEIPKSVNNGRREAEKSDVIFYEAAKSFGGAELLDDYDYWADDEKYKFEMLQTGEFHGNEVEAKSGEKWLGLFNINDEFVLRNEKITVRRVRDFTDDENSKAKRGKSVSVKSKTKPLFLLKNAGNFGEGRIKTLFKGMTFDESDESNSITEMKKGFVQTYQIGGANYTLRVERVFNKKMEILFALILESEQVKQILHVSSEDYLGTLFWVGDLDHDNKPDFFLSPWIKENITDSSLFVSSEAEKNNLVEKVASMTTVGC